MTWQDLKAFVGAADVSDSQIQTDWNTAVILVDAYAASAYAEVPAAILDRAYLMVGAEMFHQKNAPQGVAQFTDWEGAPVRVARDPMIPAYALLSNYVVGF